MDLHEINVNTLVSTLTGQSTKTQVQSRISTIRIRDVCMTYEAVRCSTNVPGRPLVPLRSSDRASKIQYVVICINMI